MLFGRFKHCLVFIQSFQDGFSIEFRRSQPPANSVGFVFDISKAIDLFGNSWIEGLETTQEFLLHPPKQKYTVRVFVGWANHFIGQHQKKRIQITQTYAFFEFFHGETSRISSFFAFDSRRFQGVLDFDRRPSRDFSESCRRNFEVFDRSVIR